MTVQQENVVDYLGIEEGTGNILLTIVDGLDWEDEQHHLLTLQNKLNTYIAFIESGEVYEKLPEEATIEERNDVPVKISVLARCGIPDGAKAFYDEAERVLATLGVELSFKVVRSPSP